MKHDGLKNILTENGFEVFKGVKSGSPLRIPLNAKTRFLKFSLQSKICLHLDKVQIFDKNGINVALNAATLVSSKYNDVHRYDGQTVIKGEPKGGCGHHTKTEVSPWLIIDLNGVYDISSIVVFNRDDAFYHRALSLQINISSDLNEWKTVFDNYAYKSSSDYNDLDYEDKCLLNCSALEIEPVKKLIHKLNAEGQKSKALELHSKANDLLGQYELSLGPHGLTRTFSIRTDDEKNKAYSALSNLLMILNEQFGVAAFASSGTLLGIVREGKLLGHDDDLDICYVSAKEKHEDILIERNALVSFLNEHGYKVTNSNVAHLWCKTPEGITIDIFTGWFTEDVCIMNPLPISGVPQNAVLPLQITKCNEHKIYIPNKPLELMILNYGPNWEKPDPLWVFDWSKARQNYKFLYF
jgi:hypothetical protein